MAVHALDRICRYEVAEAMAVDYFRAFLPFLGDSADTAKLDWKQFVLGMVRLPDRAGGDMIPSEACTHVSAQDQSTRAQVLVLDDDRPDRAASSRNPSASSGSSEMISSRLASVAVAGESDAQMEARRARLRLVFEMFAENGRIGDREFTQLVRQPHRTLEL